ncbi:Asp23/Gls24 family envelope stress response protein, partial [Kineococcus sp. NPDC059986]|uniref:Asp23/Gls24 family envelope stress response protein n=1 Tax=Kineococcus sp. NPDC059986 TaxID=3155538 RepID=UPI00344E2D2E
MSDATTSTTRPGATTRNSSATGLGSEHGSTTIADTVVSKIAGIAARDISGVHALGGGAARA